VVGIRDVNRTIITESDEGKRVVNADGNQIGLVSSVDDGTAYIDPAPDLTDKIAATFGWTGSADGEYPLEGAKVDTITDEEIRLQRGL
jgi:hypothetical protein